jgi:hypothetical protein
LTTTLCGVTVLVDAESIAENAATQQADPELVVVVIVVIVVMLLAAL